MPRTLVWFLLLMPTPFDIDALAGQLITPTGLAQLPAAPPIGVNDPRAFAAAQAPLAAPEGAPPEIPQGQMGLSFARPGADPVTRPIDPVFDFEGALVNRGGTVFEIRGGRSVPVETSAGPLTVRPGRAVLTEDGRSAPNVPGAVGPAETISASGARRPARRRTTTVRDARQTQARDILDRNMAGITANIPEYRRDAFEATVKSDPRLETVVTGMNRLNMESRIRDATREYGQAVRAASNPELTPEQRAEIIQQANDRIGTLFAAPNEVSESVARKEADDPARKIAAITDQLEATGQVRLQDAIITNPRTGMPEVMRGIDKFIAESPEQKNAEARLLKERNAVSEERRQAQEDLLKIRIDALKASMPILDEKNPVKNRADDPIAYDTFEKNQAAAQMRFFREAEAMTARVLGTSLNRPQDLQRTDRQDPAPEAITSTPVRPLAKIQNVTREEYLQWYPRGVLQDGDAFTDDAGNLFIIEPGGKLRQVP